MSDDSHNGCLFGTNTPMLFHLLEPGTSRSTNNSVSMAARIPPGMALVDVMSSWW